MFVPVGCKRVSELENRFLSDARKSQSDQAYIARLCDAPSLRSVFAFGMNNSLARSVALHQLQSELFCGLASLRLERFLLENAGRLRLIGRDGCLCRVEPDILLGKLDASDADVELLSDSEAKEILLNRARDRLNWFEYLTEEWNLRPIAARGILAAGRGSRLDPHSMKMLQRCSGSPLYVVVDDVMEEAAKLISISLGRITRADLAAELGLSLDGQKFKNLWAELKASGVISPSRGRPRRRTEEN